jgi:hypothetical protein
LDEHALASVDQQHGRLSGRCACRHITGVLFVARGIGYDEAAHGCRKEPIGNIDGDALLSFRLQAVHEQRKIQALTLGAKFF